MTTGTFGETIEVLIDLFKALVEAADLDKHERTINNDREWRDLTYRYAPIYQRHQVDLFKEQFRRSGTISFRDMRRYIYLPSPANEAPLLPVLDCHITSGGTQFATRLILIKRAPDGQLYEFGVRFESGSGDHTFNHAQLYNASSSLAPDWLPETQPAIPILASDDNVVNTFMCAVLSLYGLSQTKRLIAKGVVRNASLTQAFALPVFA